MSLCIIVFIHVDVVVVVIIVVVIVVVVVDEQVEVDRQDRVGEEKEEVEQSEYRSLLANQNPEFRKCVMVYHGVEIHGAANVLARLQPS